MSAHGPHFDQPGYDERQILHDGCEECERRGADVQLALGHMDRGTFRRALARAIAWQTRGVDSVTISRAEYPVLVAIHGVVAKLAEAELIDPLVVMLIAHGAVEPPVCPHCGSPDVDRGATGLDQCKACNGLSRGGRTLREAGA